MMEKRETRVCQAPLERRDTPEGGVIKELKVNEENEVTVGFVETREIQELIILNGVPEAKRVKLDQWESQDQQDWKAKKVESEGGVWQDEGDRSVLRVPRAHSVKRGQLENKA